MNKMETKPQDSQQDVSNIANNVVYEENRNSYGAVNRNRKQYVLDEMMPTGVKEKADEITKQIDEEIKKAEKSKNTPMYDNNYLDKIKAKQ